MHFELHRGFSSSKQTGPFQSNVNILTVNMFTIRMELTSREFCRLGTVLKKFCSNKYNFTTSASFAYPVLFGWTAVNVDMVVSIVLGRNGPI